MSQASKIIYLRSLMRQGSNIENLFKLIFISLHVTAYKLFHPKPIKKTKKIIIFTNLYYTGNPRAVYERMLEREDVRKKYEVYWMTSNLNEFLKLRREGKPVLYKHGLLSIRTYLAADLWVLAHRGAINFPTILQSQYRSLKKLQLWHGVGPKGTDFTGAYDEFDGWCMSSEFIKKKHIELWSAPPHKLYVTGFARLDRLLKYLQTPPDKLRDMLNIPKEFKKIILYAPTFDIGLWPWGDPYKGIAQLAKFLKKYRSYLLLRTHPYAKYNRKKLKKYLKSYDNIKFVPMNKYPDTMLLLAVSDLLITDWSSIYTDYLVTRRPIIFIEVNKKYFTFQRGLSEVPPEYRPGYMTTNSADFYEVLAQVIQEKKAFNLEFYEKCLHLIHGAVSGKYSDNVIDLIENILK